jgi:hypothetical protein
MVFVTPIGVLKPVHDGFILIPLHATAADQNVKRHK